MLRIISSLINTNMFIFPSFPLIRLCQSKLPIVFNGMYEIMVFLEVSDQMSSVKNSPTKPGPTKQRLSTSRSRTNGPTTIYSQVYSDTILGAIV